jgi:hypothetical protein
MSLVVSLRVPDGIIMAADSLATVRGQLHIQASAQGLCPKCDEPIELLDIIMPPIPLPVSTFSYAQKLFRFQRDFGIATFGESVVAGRTMAYHVRRLEVETANRKLGGVSELAEIVREYFEREFHSQLGDKVDQIPDDVVAFGFHVGGYDWEKDQQGRGNPVAKTCEVRVGKKATVKEHTEPIGYTCSGVWQIFATLFEYGQKQPGAQINLGAFSLQDGVDFATFVIETTAQYQRFAQQIPDVGGEVDVALITPHDGFQWIRQKQMARLLEQNRCDPAGPLE